MEVTPALLIAMIAVGLFGTWCYGLWRGWRHASRDQTRGERLLAVTGIALLMLVPVGLAVGGASVGTAKAVIAAVMAAVVPVLIMIGLRDHRRRERRSRARRHGDGP